MTALRSLLFNVLFFVWSAAVQIAGLPLLLPRRGTFWIARVWVRGSLALLAAVCGLRHEIRGRANLPTGACLIASKHQSAWDTMIFALLVEGPSYVFKRELLRIPLFGWYVARSGCISVDRSAGAAAVREMVRQAREVAAENRAIIIFPEGTRVAPGAHRPYHPGVAALYGSLGVPVVPVALNSGLYWGRRSFLKRPGRIVLEFLPPIPPGLPRSTFLAELERRIEPASRALLEAASAAPLRPAPTPCG